jgi:hypothetical protein
MAYKANPPAGEMSVYLWKVLEAPSLGAWQ